MLGLGGSFLERATRRRVDRLRRERFEHGGLLANFVRDVDADEGIVIGRPMIDMVGYRELLGVLPDKIVESLERARLERAGLLPMFKAGLGYQALLSSIIVDAAAVGSSLAEAKLAPALVIPANFMQPGGIPGKTLRLVARGRSTTLTTAATLILRNRIAATDVITGNILAQTGAMAADATAQTNTQWSYEEEIVARSVGSAGTVFAQGEANWAPHSKATAANQALAFAGSAGSATPASAVWDMGVAQFFQLTAQWSLATAYSIQTHQYLVEDLN